MPRPRITSPFSTDTVALTSTLKGVPGEYTDAESGLVYLRARYYDPATAQFLTRDPIELLTGDPYGYANGNPLMFTDPTGLYSVDDFVGDTLSGVSTGLGYISATTGAVAIGCTAAVITAAVCGAPLGLISVGTGLSSLYIDLVRYNAGYLTEGEVAGSFCSGVVKNPISQLACATVPELIDGSSYGRQRVAYVEEWCDDEYDT